MSEQRKYRSFTAQKKLEIVLAGVRGDVSVNELCRSHEIAETRYYSWRKRLLEGGKSAFAGKEERQDERALKQRIRELERALGKKTCELEVAGGRSIAGLAVRARAARSRELIAKGRRPAVVARVPQVKSQRALPDAETETGGRAPSGA